MIGVLVVLAVVVATVVGQSMPGDDGANPFDAVAAASAALSKQPRPEFKHSLKGPFFMVRSTSIPFWDFGGSAAVMEEHVRLTPAAKSKKGYLWNKRKAMMKSWEVIIDFRVNGGGRSGADGFAFWYAKEPKIEGSAFGSKDQWNGLGVFFDTYDNDGMRDNPTIFAAVNDGSWTFANDKDADGNNKVGSCKRLFRNTQKPARVRIRYQGGQLSVATDLLRNDDFSECFSAAVDLPQGYHFGVTAETGFYFDNHDIYSVQTSDLEPLSYSEIVEQMKARREQEKSVEDQMRQHQDSLQQRQQQQDGDDRQFEQAVQDLRQNSYSYSDSNGNSNGDGEVKPSAMDSMIDVLQDRLRGLEKRSSDKDVELERLTVQINSILHSHEQALDQLKRDGTATGGNAMEDPLTVELRDWLQRVDDAVRVAQEDIASLQRLSVAEDLKSMAIAMDELRTEVRHVRDTVQGRPLVERSELEKATANSNAALSTLRGEGNSLKKRLAELEDNPPSVALPVAALVLSIFSMAMAAFAFTKKSDRQLPR